MEVRILLGVIMSIIGILEIIIGLIFCAKEKKLKLRGIKTQAEIIKLEWLGRGYRPTVEYQTIEGTIEKKSKSSSSRIFFPFNEGDIVNIYYDENKVGRYRFEGNRIWNFIIVIMFLTAIFSFIWIGVFYLIF